MCGRRLEEGCQLQPAGVEGHCTVPSVSGPRAQGWGGGAGSSSAHPQPLPLATPSPGIQYTVWSPAGMMAGYLGNMSCPATSCRPSGGGTAHCPLPASKRPVGQPTPPLRTHSPPLQELPRGAKPSPCSATPSPASEHPQSQHLPCPSLPLPALSPAHLGRRPTRVRCRLPPGWLASPVPLMGF